jgi:hypothetical protein
VLVLYAGSSPSSAGNAHTSTAEAEPNHSSPQDAKESVIICDCNANDPSSPQKKNEIMTDRCSAGVAIPPSYDAKPDAPGTVHLVRDKNGRTEWSPPFTVKLGDNGHIRWWCNSTKGNIFDPGTWRIQSAMVGAKFDDSGTVHPTIDLKFTDSSFKGWTPERSRCDNHSTKIRARLGPDRLLQIECLGK